jgi:hypothetical protein
MQPFRATLSDDSGQKITEIEGSIQSADEARGSRQGEFEFQETEAFMQGVLEEKSFRLAFDDGSQLTIQIDSVSTTEQPGYSKVAFSCA